MFPNFIKKNLFPLIIGLFCSLSATSQSKAIFGIVKDSLKNNSLEAVNVYLYDSEGKNTDTSITDNKGLFHFSGLEDSSYDVIIMHPGYVEKRYTLNKVNSEFINCWLVDYSSQPKSNKLLRFFKTRIGTWKFWLLLFLLSVLIYEIFKFRKLYKVAKEKPFLSSVSIKGEIAKYFDSKQADLLIFSHFSTINNLFQRTEKDSQTLYGEVSEITKVFTFTELKQVSELNIKQKDAIKIGPVEFHIQDIFNIILFTLRLVNWYYKKFSKLKIYITLAAVKDEFQLTINRPVIKKTQSKACSSFSKLVSTNKDKSLQSISGLLWDSIFMIYQIWLGNDIPGKNWEGMKHFTEGLMLVELYSKTNKIIHLDTAIESYKEASLKDYQNDEILYVLGYLLLHKRSEDSINEAVLYLSEALKTKDLILKILINSALANCYSQMVHRLGKNAILLDVARRHIRNGNEDKHLIETEHEKLKESEIGKDKERFIYSKVKLEYAEAFCSLTEASKGALDDKEAQEMYSLSARQFENAQKRISDLNGQQDKFSNEIGFINLTLAENTKTEDFEQKGINEKKLSKLAEEYFLKAINNDPANKLVYANLCRTYATPYFIKEDKLSLCEEYGYKAIRLDENYINGYKDLASSYLAYNEVDKGIEQYNNAISKAAATNDKVEEIKNDIIKKLKNIIDEDIFKKFVDKKILKNSDKRKFPNLKNE